MKHLVTRLIVLCSLLSALVIVPGPQAAHAAGLCYVNHAAGGSNDGSSWANAYTDLQSALTNAGCTQVWVAAGVYYPTSSTDRTASFVVNPGVAVYGGFAGTETLLTQRVLGAHLTILSGDIDHNDVNTDGNHIDETTADIQGFNSYNVVSMNGTGANTVTATTVLDGFTITGGQANGGSIPQDEGGGLYCGGSGAGHECSPTLSNLTFSGNLASDCAGGLMNDARTSGISSPQLNTVSFNGNSTPNVGGAVCNYGAYGGTSSPRYTNVTFYANTATDGAGAMYNGGAYGTSSPILMNVTFSNNSTGSGGDGGAVFNEGTMGTSTPTLDGVTFSGNHAGLNGGAVFNSVLASGTSSPTIGNSILWGDTSGSTGPEIYNDSATASFVYSDVQGSGGSGGSWDASLGSDGGGNIDMNPLLAPLTNNGGFVQTMALRWNSPAIDAGLDFVCPGPGYDARGVTRPQGAHCDMGAYERIPPIARADFDGNRASDLSVFRPSTGVWYVKNQFNTTWGQAGDVPVPADYNGDGRTDVAIWRPSTGVWYVKGQFNSAWGQSGDVPVPGDYNGDKIADVAVWRPSNGTWYVKGQFTTVWGQSGDIPVPADYNGDGKTDLAVFRPSTGMWYIKGVGNFAWGQSGDIPVPADYNGYGKADLAVFRPSTGMWYIQGVVNAAWGTSTDIPVPGTFNSAGIANIAAWRPSNGTWYVRSFLTTTWGANGDFPLVAPDTNGNGTPYQ